MKGHLLPKSLGLLGIALGFSFTVSCGGGRTPDGLTRIDAAVTQCAPDSAGITVGDGYLQINCGCLGAGETAGKVYLANQPLTCHLNSSKSVVFFYFFGRSLPHQIVSTGDHFFAPTPVYDPNTSAYQAFGITFSQSAVTYSFTDALSVGLSGQIFVP